MSELPRYRLTQPAYMRKHPRDDMESVLAEGVEVEWDGLPGEHMEPINDTAHEKVQAHGLRTLRPEMRLPLGAARGGEAGALMRQQLGADLTDDASVITVVAALAIRIGALEAQVAALTGTPLARVGTTPPAPPLPKSRAA